MGTQLSDLEREIMARLNSDPTLRALFGPAHLQPRYRYWQTPDGAMYVWTTERLSDGKYASTVYRPVGTGSRSGKQNVTEWKPEHEVHHATRRAAKARALALYEKAKAI